MRGIFHRELPFQQLIQEKFFTARDGGLNGGGCLKSRECCFDVIQAGDHLRVAILAAACIENMAEAACHSSEQWQGNGQECNQQP